MAEYAKGVQHPASYSKRVERSAWYGGVRAVDLLNHPRVLGCWSAIALLLISQTLRAYGDKSRLCVEAGSGDPPTRVNGPRRRCRKPFGATSEPAIPSTSSNPKEHSP